MLRQSIAIAVVSCIVGIAVGHRAAMLVQIQPSEPVPDESLMILNCTKPIVIVSEQPPPGVPFCMHLNVTHTMGDGEVPRKFRDTITANRDVQLSAELANGQRVTLFAQSDQ